MLLWALACKPDPGGASPEVDVPDDWQTLDWQSTCPGWLVQDGADVWAVDAAGAVWDADDGWSRLDVAPLSEDGSVYVGGASAGDGALWVLASGVIASLDGDQWDAVDLPVGVDAAHIVARADGTVVVVGSRQDTVDCYDSCEIPVHTTVAVYDGRWRVETQDLPGWIYAITETDDGALVGVGSGIVARWDDPAWTVIQQVETSLWDVASRGDEVVAVGSGGAVLRGPLDALAQETVGDRELYQVDIGEDGAVWATSALGYTDGRLWVDSGDGWSSVALPADSAWFDVLARDGAAWLVGDDAGSTVLEATPDGTERLLHEPGMSGMNGASIDADGTARLAGRYGQVGHWSAGGLEVWSLPPPSPYEAVGEIAAVAAHGADDVVAITQNDGIFAFDGATWTLAWSDPDGDVLLWSGAMAPDGAAFAVGRRYLPDETEVPVFLRRVAGVWTEEAAPLPVNSRSLFAVQAFAADDVYALTWGEDVALLHWDGAAWSLVAPTCWPRRRSASGAARGPTCTWGAAPRSSRCGTGTGRRSRTARAPRASCWASPATTRRCC